MTPARSKRCPHRAYETMRLAGLASAICVLALSGAGCSSVFNPSFLALVTNPVPDTSGAVPEITIENAAGHVPIFFVNNTRFDQTLLNYFADLGIDVTGDNLRPRVRMRVNIDYVNGSQNTIEFLDGSDLVQGSILTSEGAQTNPLIPASLTRSALTSIVAACNVDQVDPSESIEVFVPAFLKVIAFEGDLLTVRVLQETIPPQFVVLERDTVDENNDVTLLANFDIRDVPVPVTDVQCGSVIGFTLTGTLRVPFVLDELGLLSPGYAEDDTTSEAASPGRFEVQTVVR